VHPPPLRLPQHAQAQVRLHGPRCPCRAAERAIACARCLGAPFQSVAFAARALMAPRACMEQASRGCGRHGCEAGVGARVPTARHSCAGVALHCMSVPWVSDRSPHAAGVSKNAVLASSLHLSYLVMASDWRTEASVTGREPQELDHFPSQPPGTTNLLSASQPRSSPHPGARRAHTPSLSVKLTEHPSGDQPTPRDSARACPGA
jgi:hypothetical protein